MLRLVSRQRLMPWWTLKLVAILGPGSVPLESSLESSLDSSPKTSPKTIPQPSPRLTSALVQKYSAIMSGYRS